MTLSIRGVLFGDVALCPAGVQAEMLFCVGLKGAAGQRKSFVKNPWGE